MSDKELQVENGNFTRIVNPLIEELVKIPFKGCELAVALFIIRKTYGFHKKEDEISLTQFQQGLDRSRQTVVTALKNLQLVNVVRLVRKGNMKGACNIWAINKYHTTWKLVNMARLVQRNTKPSLTERLNLVQTGRHTKEIQKKYTKERPPTSEFDQFWDKYPKKVGKTKALGIWQRKKLEPYLLVILEFIEKASATDRWKKGFVPDPTTFLNQERWNDDVGSYNDKKEEGLKITRY